MGDGNYLIDKPFHGGILSAIFYVVSFTVFIKTVLIIKVHQKGLLYIISTWGLVQLMSCLMLTGSQLYCPLKNK